MIKPINVELFVNSYLATASWVTADSDENGEFTKESIEIARKDCLDFIGEVLNEFGLELGTDLLNRNGIDVQYLSAHNFFLTRNYHGSGFWDSASLYDGQENADKLTTICENIGSVECYHIDGKKSKLTF